MAPTALLEIYSQIEDVSEDLSKIIRSLSQPKDSTAADYLLIGQLTAAKAVLETAQKFVVKREVRRKKKRA